MNYELLLVVLIFALCVLLYYRNAVAAATVIGAFSLYSGANDDNDDNDDNDNNDDNDDNDTNDDNDAEDTNDTNGINTNDITANDITTNDITTNITTASTTNNMFNEMLIEMIGGAAPQDNPSLNNYVIEYLDSFPQVDLQLVNALCNDIAYDINAALKTTNTTAQAKVILDTIIHHHLYDNKPNTYSAQQLRKNIVYLRKIKNSVFSSSLNKLISTVSLRLEKKDTEEKISVAPNEWFRNMMVGAELKSCDDLRDEITRLNIQVRNTVLSDAALRADPNILAECTRERRLLQDKVYELRKDIDNLRSHGYNFESPQCKELTARIEDLRKHNGVLEQQLAAEHQRVQQAIDAQRTAQQSAQNSAASQISKIQAELQDCNEMLNHVLSDK